MTTGVSPYQTPTVTDINTDPNIVEVQLTVSEQNVKIYEGPTPADNIFANAEVINGTIPGPTLRLNVGDTVVVRLINMLPHESGIHWHGIELHSSADGTPVTQDGVAVGPFPQPVPLSPSGGTYLYKFTVTRPGIFWYHPHHHHSTNRVFRGTYGMIIVTDPNEAALVGSVLPSAAETVDLVLSDTTVCKVAGSNDAETYPLGSPWVGGTFTVQQAPKPVDLCELSPLNEDGTPAAGPFAAGDIPRIQQSGAGRTNEGQIVLTNGMNVGARGGDPATPAATLEANAFTHPVQAGQGLRLRIVNSATIRYFRLILTTSTGVQLPLVRVGGEGGLLADAVIEGGTIGAGFDTKYTSGEILLPPASRADVVVAIPASATGVLTLWTQDYARTGQGFSHVPTVPVMHLNVTGVKPGTAYTIANGTGLLSTIPGASPVPVPAPTTVLQNPATFVPPKTGMSSQDIQFTNTGGLGINNVSGSFGGFAVYTDAPHIGSTRFAKVGDTLELTVTNTMNAHHPFHLHGFSFQPISLAPRAGAPPAVTGSYTWPYTEFRDNIDVPANYTLTFRVNIADRALADNFTLGGALGRWLFHCHIFFHAHQGMISEFVVTDADGSGKEKPYIDVGGSWAYAPLGGIATRKGTYAHPDGLPIVLSASIGIVTDLGAGKWSWELDTSLGPTPASIQYVYITAADSDNRKDQAVFRLKVGAPDDGSDSGDVHLRTVDGTRYDFQSVGEFILLRDYDGIEIQTRQSPVVTANPITDAYSGLTACVSLNTAVAVRVAGHAIAYQQAGEQGQLRLYLDGKPISLPDNGLNLKGNHISYFDAEGGNGLRIDYAHGPVVQITPRFWTSHQIWYMNVNVSHTLAEHGLMGRISRPNWLPNLPSGQTMGPKPKSLADRYTALYKTFTNAWRVTDANSMFVYAPGTSTETFTDRDWPAIELPCELKPGFGQPGAPIPAGIDIEQAQALCQAVTEPDLHQFCVFDVATFGDQEFAKGYEFAQKLRLTSTSVQLVPSTCENGQPGFVAIVLPLHGSAATPRGQVQFIVDGKPFDAPRSLNNKGRACLPMNELKPGQHTVQVVYESEDGQQQPSSSPTVTHTVPKDTGTGTTGKWCCSPLCLVILLLIVIILFVILC